MYFTAQDSNFMALAIQLANKGFYTTRSNPRVGCVLVKDNQVIAQGWHQKAGLAHAEINALKALEKSSDAIGSTAYVTLEPCAHQGKTPACAQALIKAKVSKVICAMLDPNPLVSGKGLALLEQAGIETAYGLQQGQAEKLNQGFIKNMTLGLPKVVCKLAMSLDGRTAMSSGESQWITGAQARADVQKLRAASGAIVTGSGTVLQDHPSMNVRAPEFLNDEFFEQPLRLVIDSKQQLSGQEQIFNLAGKSEQISLPLSPEGQVDLRKMLQQLAKQGINDLLIEAGHNLAGAFIQQGLIDELVIYMAPKLMGSKALPLMQLPFDLMSETIELELLDMKKLGQDLKMTYRIKQN